MYTKGFGYTQPKRRIWTHNQTKGPRYTQTKSNDIDINNQTDGYGNNLTEGMGTQYEWVPSTRLLSTISHSAQSYVLSKH